MTPDLTNSATCTAPSSVDHAIVTTVAVAKYILDTITEEPEEIIEVGQQSNLDEHKHASSKGKEVVNHPILVQPPSPLLVVLSEACPRTLVHLANDEGYNVVSMIITPHVPNLVETKTEVGTSGEKEMTEQHVEESKNVAGWFDPFTIFMLKALKRTKEGNTIPLILGESMFDKAATDAIVEGCIPPGMVAEASEKTMNERIGLLKQAAIISCSSTLALDKEILRLTKDCAALEDLAKHRLERIEMLEASLTNER